MRSSSVLSIERVENSVRRGNKAINRKTIQVSTFVNVKLQHFGRQYVSHLGENNNSNLRSSGRTVSRWSIMVCTMRIASSNVLLQIAVTSLISWMRWSEKYSVQERRPVYSTSWVMEVGFFIFLVCKVYTNMECMMTRRRATDTADSCLKERIWICSIQSEMCSEELCAEK